MRRLLGVYDEVAELAPAAALQHEEAAALVWLRGLADRGGVPDNRTAVIDRGRRQLASGPA
jgi:hypothetical protein